jgi:two-component system chemotaxis response regulator CheY
MPSPDATKPVLVIDDYPTILRIMRRLLERAGFAEVDAASDAEEALAKLRARPYGLVLSDWHMAPLSGYELLKQVKADAETRDIPFVMISADASPENAAAAREAGALGYIVKPFDAETLRARVAAALRP